MFPQPRKGTHRAAEGEVNYDMCVCRGGGGEMKHHFLLEWMGNWVFSDFVSSIALSCSLD